MKRVENFELYLELGRGQFGKVFLCRLRHSNTNTTTLRPVKKDRAVACKMMP